MEEKNLVKAFREIATTLKGYGENDVFSRAQKFSWAVRNTNKLFRELYGTVFGTEKFSGLLNNARRKAKMSSLFISKCYGH